MLRGRCVPVTLAQLQIRDVVLLIGFQTYGIRDYQHLVENIALLSTRYTDMERITSK
jgi:hypothetical protein